MIARTGTPIRTTLSLVIIVLLSGALTQVSAQQQQAAPQMKEHVVRKGDTLWSLAGFYFMNPLLWPTIFEANRDVVEDPHWIYPDERLRIPGVESGLAVAVEPQANPASGPEAGMPMGQPNVPSRTRFYTPPSPVSSERESDLLESRLPLFPVSAAEFHSAAWIENPSDLGIRGELMGLADPGSQKDKLSQFLHPFDRVLIGRLSGGALQPADTMLVVRIVPPSGSLGYVIAPVALVRIDSTNERIASASIVQQYGEARAGDRIIPMRNLPPMERVVPQPVLNGPEGRLIAFVEREPLYGTLDNGFIDLGEASGIAVGDEFMAYVPSRPGSRASEMLPEQEVARLTVIKVMPNTATVRVADASSTALQAGVRVRLVRKMP